MQNTWRQRSTGEQTLQTQRHDVLEKQTYMVMHPLATTAVPEHYRAAKVPTGQMRYQAPKMESVKSVSDPGRKGTEYFSTIDPSDCQVVMLLDKSMYTMRRKGSDFKKEIQ